MSFFGQWLTGNIKYFFVSTERVAGIWHEQNIAHGIWAC
jgi:hypothetical protein